MTQPNATLPPPANPFGVVASVVERVKGLRPTDQLKVLMAVLVTVVALVAIISTEPDAKVFAGGIVGIVAMVAVMLFARHVLQGTLYALLILASLLAVIFIQAGGLQSLQKSRWFQGANPETERDTVWLSGNVRWRGSNNPIVGAAIALTGSVNSMAFAVTGQGGAFSVGILRGMLRDTVVFAVTVQDATTLDTFPVRPYGYDIQIDQRISAVAGRVPLASFASASVPLAATRGRQQHRDTVRVVLDSIRVKQDGRIGWASWQFEVEVNDDEELKLPYAGYNDNAGWSTVLVGREIQARIGPREGLELSVTGTRMRFFGQYKAQGDTAVDRTVYGLRGAFTTQVHATVRGDKDEGDFEFFFTIAPFGHAPVQVRQPPPQTLPAGEMASRRPFANL